MLQTRDLVWALLFFGTAASLQVTITPAQGEISVGESKFFLCEVVGEVKNISWISPSGEMILPNRQGISVSNSDEESSTLTIYNANIDNAGIYKCVARNAGQESQATVNVKIYQKLTFKNAPTPQEFNEGADADIICDVVSSPPPTIIWRFKGTKIQVEKDVRFRVMTNNHLQIRGIKKIDEGAYTCEGRIMARGEIDYRVMNVIVNVLPTIRTRQAELNATGEVGQSVMLACDADGYPEPTVTWERDGEILETVSKYSINDDGSELVIKDVKKLDEGEYTCIAKNKAGEKREEIGLKVFVQPKITYVENMTTIELVEQVTLTCEATGDPTPSIIWSFGQRVFSEESQASWTRTEKHKDLDGAVMVRSDARVSALTLKDIQFTDAGQYICTARNSIGQDAKGMYLEVRYAPKLQGTVAVYTWEGNPVNITCEVLAHPSASVVWFRDGQQLPSSNTTNVKIFNTPAANYLEVTPDSQADFGSYNCTATNAIGIESREFLLVQADVPSVLRIDSVEPYSSTALVKFDEPDANGGVPVLRYKAEWRLLGHGDWTEKEYPAGDALDAVTITGLKPETKYEVKMSAINGKGEGESSTPRHFKTLPVHYSFTMTSKSPLFEGGRCVFDELEVKNFRRQVRNVHWRHLARLVSEDEGGEGDQDFMLQDGMTSSLGEGDLTSEEDDELVVWQTTVPDAILVEESVSPLPTDSAERDMDSDEQTLETLHEEDNPTEGTLFMAGDDVAMTEAHGAVQSSKSAAAVAGSEQTATNVGAPMNVLQGGAVTTEFLVLVEAQAVTLSPLPVDGVAGGHATMDSALTASTNVAVVLLGTEREGTTEPPLMIMRDDHTVEAAGAFESIVTMQTGPSGVTEQTTPEHVTTSQTTLEYLTSSQTEPAYMSTTQTTPEFVATIQTTPTYVFTTQTIPQLIATTETTPECVTRTQITAEYMATTQTTPEHVVTTQTTPWQLASSVATPGIGTTEAPLTEAIPHQMVTPVSYTPSRTPADLYREEEFPSVTAAPISTSTPVLREPNPPKLEGKLHSPGNALKLNWIKQDDGGSPIKHYLVRYKAKHMSDWKPEIRLPSGSEYVVLNSLDWNTEYEVYVVAENQQGKSQPGRFSIRTSPEPTAMPDPIANGSGLGTGAIVGILIVVFVLLLVGVDVTCYFLNKCGLLMCIAVNFCGKSGPGAKSKDIEEGKAAFTKDESKEPIVEVRTEEERTPNHEGGGQTEPNETTPLTEPEPAADTTATVVDLLPSVTTNSDTVTETFGTAQNSPASETTTLTSSTATPAADVTATPAPQPSTPKSSVAAPSDAAPKVAPLVDLSDGPVATDAPRAAVESAPVAPEPNPPAAQPPKSEATTAPDSTARPPQNQDCQIDGGPFQSSDIDLATDVFEALGKQPKQAPADPAAVPAPAQDDKTPVDDKSKPEETEVKKNQSEVKTVPNEAPQTNGNESKA